MSANMNLPRKESGANAAAADSAFGVLADQAKDNCYMARNGFIYTSPWVATKSTTRFSASILLTAKGAPFELTANGQAHMYKAVTIRPVFERGLRAENVQLISVQVNPYHPLYRRFRAIPHPGYLELDREAYREFDEALEAAYLGTLSGPDARQLLEDIIACTSRRLPKVKHADKRIDRALEMLLERPNYPLTELAAAIGLSYDRMSHLFAQVVGLPLRSYLLWVKIHNASRLRGSGMTLTEIADAAGFNNSAHLCNTWQQAFGNAPSSFFSDVDFIRIHTTRRAAQPPVGVLTQQGETTNQPAADKPAVVCHHCGSHLKKPQ